MRERKLFMALGIVLAVLALGLAYAAVSTGLEITGSATGEFDPNNFQVRFSKVSAVTGTNEVDTSGSTAEIDSTDPTNGTFYFTGFKTKGQTQSATWTISNESDSGLYAHIAAYSAMEINREYFKATWDLADEVIAPKGTTTLTVTVECIKVPDKATVKSGVMTFGFSVIPSADEELEKDDSGNPIVTPDVIPTVPIVTAEVSDITTTGATITAVGTDAGGDELQYTLKLNGTIYEEPSTTNTWTLSNLTELTTYRYEVEVTDGKYKAAATGEFTTLQIERIPTTTDYVGCYADIDDDGTVDGIIFADQAVGTTGTGECGTNGYGTYEVPKIESGLKEYYISQESYTDDFGTAPVISPATDGVDRFFVIGLDNFTMGTFYLDRL